MKKLTKITLISVLIFVIILFTFNSVMNFTSHQIQDDNSLGTVYVVPHSHWDPYYRFGYKECMELTAGNIRSALDLIAISPDFRYTIDQMDILRYFWINNPEYREDLRQAILLGRVEITGPGVCEPDENIPQEEALLENFLAGMRWLEEIFGVSARVMWQTDVFGHTAEFPKLMQSIGFEYLYIHRAYNTSSGPFIWEAEDNSEVLVWKFDYNRFPATSLDFVKMMKDIIEEAETESYNNPSKKIMWPVGQDFMPAHPNMVQMVDFWNNLYARKMGYKAIISTPSRFFDDFKTATNYSQLFRYKGDLNPTLSGGQTSYIGLKQSQRTIEHLLLSSERFAVLNNLFAGTRYPEQQLFDLWWNDTLYQHHDTITGTSALEVAREYPIIFGQLETNSQELLDAQLSTLSGVINTSAPIGNLTYVLFNSLAWDRHEIVEIPIYIPTPGVQSISVYDINKNQKVPIQIVYQSNHTLDDSIQNASVFIDATIPSLGFNSYAIKYNTSYENPLPTDFQVPNVTISDGANSFNVTTDSMNLTFSKLKGGDLVSLIYNNVEVLDTSKSASIHLYNGSNSIYSVELRGFINKTANQNISNITIIENGPLFGKFKISNQLNGFNFERVVTIYWNNSIINFDINLTTTYEYAAMVTAEIPLGIQSPQMRLGTQFGSWIPQSYKQKLNINLPSQYWVTGYNDSIGLGIIDYGLVSKRVASNSFYIDLFHNSALVPEPDNTKVYDEEKQAVVNFAIFPYEKNISQPNLEIKPVAYQTGYEYNFPIYVQSTSNHSGTLPAEYSLLSINQSKIILTRLTEIDGNLTLRMFNADNNENVSFSLDLANNIPEPFENLQLVNSLGINGQNLSFTQGGFNDTLNTMALQTYLIDRDYNYSSIELQELNIGINQFFLLNSLEVSIRCATASKVELLYSYTGTSWERVELLKQGQVFTLSENIEPKSNLYLKFNITDTNGDIHIVEYGVVRTTWDIFTLILINGLAVACVVLLFLFIRKRLIRSEKKEPAKSIKQANEKSSKIQFYLMNFTLLFILSNIMFLFGLNQTSNMFPYYNAELFYMQIFYYLQNDNLLIYLLIGMGVCTLITSLVFIYQKQIKVNPVLIVFYMLTPIVSLLYLMLWAIILQNPSFSFLLSMELQIFTQTWLGLIIYGLVFVLLAYVIYKFQRNLVKVKKLSTMETPIFTKGIIQKVQKTLKENRILKISIHIIILSLSFYLFYLIVPKYLMGPSGGEDLIETFNFVIYIGLFWLLAYPFFYLTQIDRKIYDNTLPRVLITSGFISLSFLISANMFYITAIPIFFFSFEMLLILLMICLIIPLASKLFIFALKTIILKMKRNLTSEPELKIKNKKEN